MTPAEFQAHARKLDLEEKAIIAEGEQALREDAIGKNVSNTLGVIAARFVEHQHNMKAFQKKLKRMKKLCDPPDE